MKRFLGGISMTRYDLLNGKSELMTKMIMQFLKFTRFETPFGAEMINKLFEKHGLEPNDDSVVAFIQRNVGEKIGLVAFEVGPDEYEFQLLIGSQEDLYRMTMEIENDSTNRNQDVSSQRRLPPSQHRSLEARYEENVREHM